MVSTSRRLPTIAILNHALPVDQERPGGMIHHTFGTPLHREPERLPHFLDGLWVTSQKCPGGEVGIEAVGVGMQDCQGIDLRLGRHRSVSSGKCKEASIRISK